MACKALHDLTLDYYSGLFSTPLLIIHHLPSKQHSYNSGICYFLCWLAWPPNFIYRLCSNVSCWEKTCLAMPKIALKHLRSLSLSL